MTDNNNNTPNPSNATDIFSAMFGNQAPPRSELMVRLEDDLNGRYDLMFAEAPSEVLVSIQEARADGLWKKNSVDGFVVLSTLNAKLSNHFGIPTPRLQEGAFECYYMREGTPHIALPKASLVSFLHEYRHHMQNSGLVPSIDATSLNTQAVDGNDDKELDARGWSISMYKLALPSNFEKAWINGRIWFMPDYRQCHPEYEMIVTK